MARVGFPWASPARMKARASSRCRPASSEASRARLSRDCRARCDDQLPRRGRARHVVDGVVDLEDERGSQGAHVVEAALGAEARVGGNRGLPQHRHDAGDDEHRHRRRHGDRRAMPPYEQPRRVAGGAAAGLHRMVGAVPGDVLGQLLDARIAGGRRAPEGAQHDGVEIALQAPGELERGGAAAGGAGARLRAADGPLARGNQGELEQLLLDGRRGGTSQPDTGARR